MMKSNLVHDPFPSIQDFKLALRPRIILRYYPTRDKNVCRHIYPTLHSLHHLCANTTQVLSLVCASTIFALQAGSAGVDGRWICVHALVMYAPTFPKMRLTVAAKFTPTVLQRGEGNGEDLVNQGQVIYQSAVSTCWSPNAGARPR